MSGTAPLATAAAKLAAIARALPGVDEGVACAGTTLESRTFRVAKKAFLFVSAKDARLKLAASAPDAKALGFEVGANGWVKLPLAALPPTAVCRLWVAESHALLARSRRRRRSRAHREPTVAPAALEAGAGRTELRWLECRSMPGMRTALVVAVALLGSCSGSRRGPAFTPSQNLAESHPWLVGRWQGEVVHTAAGTSHAATLQFDGPVPAGRFAPAVLDVGGPAANGYTLVEADGERVRFRTLQPGASVVLGYYETLFEGTVEQETTMRLTWRNVGTMAGRNGLSGTAVLTRVAPLHAVQPAIVEAPDGEERWQQVWLRVPQPR